VTAGGAGVLISALARALVIAGHTVHILAALSPEVCSEWLILQKDLKDYGTLMVHPIETVASFTFYQDIFVSRSLQFSKRVEKLSDRYGYDIIEFFEYAGPASLYLLRRYLGIGHRPRKEPKLVVRVHGSLEAIDAAEGTRPSQERLRMYLMERFAMVFADAVIFPSQSMASLYQKKMAIWPRKWIVGMPPINMLLNELQQNSVRVVCDRYLKKKDGFHFLVLGKIQNNKNPVLVAKAAVELFQRNPEVKATVTYVGDVFRAIGNQTNPMDEVLKCIPKEVSERFFFIEKIERQKILRFASCFNAAIVASTFESFNLVAHELYTAAKLPLVISDFEGFREFFNDKNTYVFNRGNATSLSTAMHKAYTGAARSREHVDLIYDDPLVPYLHIVDDSSKVNTSLQA